MQERSISHHIKEYVRSTGDGLAEISKKTGIPKSTLNPWLRDEKPSVSTATLDKLCVAYEIFPVRLNGTESQSVPTVSQIAGPMCDSERSEYLKEIDRIETLCKQKSDSLLAIWKMLEKIVWSGN